MNSKVLENFMDREEGPVVQKLRHGKQGWDLDDGEVLEEAGDEESDFDIRNPPRNHEEFLKALERERDILRDLKLERQQKRRQSGIDEYRSHAMIVPQLTVDLLPKDRGVLNWDEIDKAFLRLNLGIEAAIGTFKVKRKIYTLGVASWLIMYCSNGF